mmetsp:Transcript_112193/g.222964  ORF Transcript_112193/g.222964 Transcript_112193/m.222964 type:complete len:499 (-) Transcript_112193:144-1640(-)
MTANRIFFITLAMPACALMSHPLTGFGHGRKHGSSGYPLTRFGHGQDTSLRKYVRMHYQTTDSKPVHVYEEECGQSRPVSTSLMQNNESSQIPGAGLGKIVPFKTVLKESYYLVGCVKDYMLEHGDKFGKNKDRYKEGSLTNVSIVRYVEIVPKEDQEPMSHGVCFSFCRTVPGMTFFGIQNGQNCYCMPYFNSMEGDDSACDQPCEGDTKTVCGNVVKSTVFQMHACGTAKKKLVESFDKMKTVSSDIEDLTKMVDGLAETMQDTAVALQTSFGKLGDTVATQLLQDAKLYAGTLAKASLAGLKISTKMGDLEGRYKDVKKLNLKKFREATKAETVMTSMQKATTEGSDEATRLGELAAKAGPDFETSGGAKRYRPVMQFVDEKFADVPSTCGGKAAGNALVAKADDCAEVCDSMLNDCDGFSHFMLKKDGLCFLFAKVETVTYYTGCKKKGAKLVQLAANKTSVTDAGLDANCMVKFSRFQGTPQATEAKRCIKDA